MVKNITKDIKELENFSASKTKVYIGGTRFNSIRNKKNGKKKKTNENKNKKKNKNNNKNNNQNKNKKNIKDMK